jgi:hypothetical protein
MKCIKLFSALLIILTVAIAPTSGVFAQSDVNADAQDKQIHKEQRREKLAIRDTEIRNSTATQSMEFKGQVSGWAIIGGKAIPATLDISGKAEKTQHSWKLNGIGTLKIGDRNVTFDLQGHARGTQIHLKGTTTEFDSVVLHLNGHFAPILGDDGIFALIFHRSAIVNEQANIRIPLALIGQVETIPIGDVIEPAETRPVDTSEDLMRLFS